ncbi:hypothetical protein IQ258_27395 [Coleofasciculus sp. LEGE 07081]|nr:hypothetical protein [Coleofasciculus sp. LEGE 07081]
MLKWLMTCLVAASLAVIAVAQEKFPGTDLPLTMQATDLSADYYPVKLKEAGTGPLGEYYSQSYFLFEGARGSDSPVIRLLAELLPISWTKGEQVSVYGQKMLVTYILEPSLDKIAELVEGKGVTMLGLKLKLMNPVEIVSIEPFPEMNKEKFIGALNELQMNAVKATPAAAKTASLSNIKQASVSILIYQADYDDIFPYVESTAYLKKVVEPYSRNLEIFKSQNPNGNGEIRYNVGIAGMLATDIDDVVGTPLLFDPTPWPDGTYLVSFTDGHAKFVSADEWSKLQKKMRPPGNRQGKPVVPPR